MDERARPVPGLPRRLAAILYDTFLVLPLIMLVVAVAMGAARVFGLGSGADALSPWIVRGLALLTCIGFFAVFWLKGGQTLGMQAWRIQLVADDGGDIGLGRVVVRCCGAALSALAFGLGYIWCVIDPRGRSWHDHLSRSSLVLLPKRGKGDGTGAGASGAAQEEKTD